MQASFESKVVCWVPLVEELSKYSTCNPVIGTFRGIAKLIVTTLPRRDTFRRRACQAWHVNFLQRISNAADWYRYYSFTVTSNNIFVFIHIPVGSVSVCPMEVSAYLSAGLR